VRAAAAAVLRAQQAPAAPEGDDAGASGLQLGAASAAADEAAASEAGFIRFLADLNMTSWRTIAVLTLLVHNMHVYFWYFFIRAQASPQALLLRGTVLSKQIRDTRLFHPRDAAAPPLTALDLPWGDIVAAAPFYIAAVVLIRLPVYYANLFFSCTKSIRPFVYRHYELIFTLLATVENSFYLFIDAYAYSLTGRVVVYALPDCIMHGFGLALFHRTGPFRRRANYFVVLYCTEAREAHLRRRYAASLAPPLKQKAA
jgi:hypothetical protein